MEEHFFTVKEAVLNNNCPECYNNNGLHLTFKQKFIETKWYKSITNETAQEIECRVCHTVIYPARWTDDIDRVFNYHQRAFKPKKTSIKLKKAAWWLIAGSVLVAAAIIATLLVWP
ncbi:hypothetical protein IA57_06755 [Mangrovimonas yunxiaonensis]|uniref:Uncharacterized protein n=1 Tax=Mangrovimonas yunxiaonensis TaxID=1197477 RepID=A0A084TLD8_9FLAO|nr:hypothetical protein [Mangrovimonas yunxiaonensis]KFB01524.1 hypothetical protein IA57_06755 [Mangrovimonas yunxiaonensis]MBR9758343.1 hypothetical protein [Algicola sp.]GGH36187.1 hypothetical protein GCM10011364_03260 [Mangrovimonas yunxiaonensis]